MRIVILMTLGVVLACDNGVEPDSPFLGKWTWVSSSGGFAGTIETPASTGKVISVEFTRKKFRKYVNSVLTEEMKYSVATEKSIFSTSELEIITYSHDWRQSYLVKGDTLFLSDECYDCFGHVYVKGID